MLTPEELGITPKELAALLMVREMLATHSVEWTGIKMLDESFVNKFNMAVPVADDCGTECCIGGWMYVFMQPELKRKNGVFVVDDTQDADNYVDGNASEPLTALFYPLQKGYAGNWIGGYSDASIDYEKIPPELAVRAIDNFLEHGKPDWEGLLKDAGLLKTRVEEGA